MRAKAKWNVEGERSTKYFCNLEKRNYTDKIISKILLDDKELTSLEDIMKSQESFYKSLYCSRNLEINHEQIREFFSVDNPFISKLEPEESNDLEGEITLMECLNVVKNLKNGTSPGLDGFTCEFYKFFLE